MTPATLRLLPMDDQGFKVCVYPLHIGERRLPLSEFNRQARSRDGRQRRCRACQGAVEGERQRGEVEDVRLTPEQQRVSRLARKVNPAIDPPDEELELEPDAEDPGGEAAYRWSVWRTYVRARAAASTRDYHAAAGGALRDEVDPLETVRWVNEVCSYLRPHLRAGKLVMGIPLDGAMRRANKDLPEGWGEEDPPGGTQPAPVKPKPRLALVESVVVEAMGRPLPRKFHREESEDEDDRTSRLRRGEYAVGQGRRVNPAAKIGDLFGPWEVVRLIPRGRRSDERVGATCTCGRQTEAYVFNLRRLKLDGCRHTLAATTAKASENYSEIIPEPPPLDIALAELPLEEMVLAELTRRPCAQVFDLQDVIEAGGDEIRAALSQLERAGRVLRSGSGRVVLWRAVRS